MPRRRRGRYRDLMSTDPMLETLRLIGPSGLRLGEVERLRRRLLTQPPSRLIDHQAPRRAGIYALYLDPAAQPIYVGKSQGQRGLAGRLDEHVQTLRLHHYVEPGKVWCRYVVYARRAPLPFLEAALIRQLRPAWNELVGFGSGPSRKGLEPIGAWEQLYPRRVAEAAPAYDPCASRARRLLDLD